MKRRILSFFLALCITAMLLPAGTASASITTDKYGVKEFTTFEDLKQLVSEAENGFPDARYVGEGDLVITEDLEIPYNYSIYVKSSAVRIPAGVTFECADLEAETVIVDGVFIAAQYGRAEIDNLIINESGTMDNFQGSMESDGIAVSEKLVVDGTLHNHGGIFIRGENVEVTGDENIEHAEGAGIRHLYYTDNPISSMEDLKKILTQAAAKSSHWLYSIYYKMESDISITETLEIPSNCDVFFQRPYPEEYDFTVESGGELVNKGELRFSNLPVKIRGKLRNSGIVAVGYDSAMEFSSAECYSGEGKLRTETLENLDQIFVNLNLDDFDIGDYQEEYYGAWDLTYAAHLPRMGAPTELEWGYFHPDSVERPGTVSWKTASPDLNKVRVEYYRDGEFYTYTEYEYQDADAGSWRSLSCLGIMDLSSGNYQFKVISLGDGQNYRNSEAVMSGVWNYTKPTEKLSTPINVKMEGNKFTWELPADEAYAGGYQIEFVVGENYENRYSAWQYTDETSFTLPEGYGPGTYDVMVRALSSDLTKRANSEWTDWQIGLEYVEPEDEPVIITTPMYRLYNPYSGEHFYTGSLEERGMLVTAGWTYEGVAWNAPVSTGDPVYRLYNPNSGDHHYTMSAEEKDMLVSVGWKYEGVAWNSATADNLPLYRLYNPNADCGSHHYTGSTEERDFLVNVGWIYEGIGWFGMLK